MEVGPQKMEVPWRREPLKEVWKMGACPNDGGLGDRGSWKAEGDPRRWRRP